MEREYVHIRSENKVFLGNLSRELNGRCLEEWLTLHGHSVKIPPKVVQGAIWSTGVGSIVRMA